MSKLVTGEAVSGSVDAVDMSTVGSVSEVVNGIEGRPRETTADEMAGMVAIGVVTGAATVGFGRKAGLMIGGRSFGLFNRLKMAALSAPRSMSDISKETLRVYGPCFREGKTVLNRLLGKISVALQNGTGALLDHYCRMTPHMTNPRHTKIDCLTLDSVTINIKARVTHEMNEERPPNHRCSVKQCLFFKKARLSALGGLG